MAGMGTAIWLMARCAGPCCAIRCCSLPALFFGTSACCWASAEFFVGDSTGYNGSNFRRYAAIVLFVAYTLVVSWAVLMFRFRRGEQIYITQWYLLGAFLWFPWLYRGWLS